VLQDLEAEVDCELVKRDGEELRPRSAALAREFDRIVNERAVLGEAGRRVDQGWVRRRILGLVQTNLLYLAAVGDDDGACGEGRRQGREEQGEVEVSGGRVEVGWFTSFGNTNDGMHARKSKRNMHKAGGKGRMALPQAFQRAVRMSFKSLRLLLRDSRQQNVEGRKHASRQVQAMASRAYAANNIWFLSCCREPPPHFRSLSAALRMDELRKNSGGRRGERSARLQNNTQDRGNRRFHDPPVALRASREEVDILNGLTGAERVISARERST
jgi:hypothetical protein